MGKNLTSKHVSFTLANLPQLVFEALMYLNIFLKIIVVFIFVLFSYNTYSQIYKPPMIPGAIPLSNAIVVDSANILIYYISNPKTYDDLQRLEIGIRLSKYYM
jgi:hypothetical protein